MSPPPTYVAVEDASSTTGVRRVIARSNLVLTAETVRTGKSVNLS